MKTKLVILISLALVLCSPAFAQKNKLATISPETVVKNLYAAHNARRSPFFQKKSRALVDKYFTGSLADAIWQDALNTKSDEVGTLNFDPLYNAQDIQITNFVIAKSTPDNVVKVRFINIGEPDEITFTLSTANTSSTVYKIESIVYSDAEDLESILRNGINGGGEETRPIDGDYLIGGVKCSVTTTVSGYWARVKCDDQENFQVIDTETLTFGTFNKKEKGRRGHFVLGDDGSIRKYIDASGKEIRVDRAK
ncbi:MAG TPA: hypothetical protein PLP07_06005 [Pyrinomonadaceae bacterium]|jgi:hypothetical protein|nr:hypothetical protein [Chloracidobacterium sp.]MBP9934341.1 hypothetical protein [Pyrinomonadaceae bacterium]MBK7801464.1 hypothetical protein [Chloracidobacterium sp.]MBK9436782.1 hypothetical protein [Chloracidobacterium sp.]MBL0241773.1 hypothetical protein [Chloracidobacterium sp.]